MVSSLIFPQLEPLLHLGLNSHLYVKIDIHSQNRQSRFMSLNCLLCKGSSLLILKLALTSSLGFSAFTLGGYFLPHTLFLHGQPIGESRYALAFRALGR